MNPLGPKTGSIARSLWFRHRRFALFVIAAGASVPVNIAARVLFSHWVRYELAVFPVDERHTCAARGHFVHAYVDRATRRPTPLTPTLLSLLETLTDATCP